MRRINEFGLMLMAVVAMLTLAHCSRPVDPNLRDKIDGCPPVSEPIADFETRPGLEGLALVPLGNIEFKVENGAWIDFHELVGNDPGTFVEVTFEVKEDGSTNILEIYGPGYPDALMTVGNAIRSWRYPPSCLTPQFTFIFSGRQGFSISQRIWGDAIGRCIECPHKIVSAHRVYNYRGYR